MGANSFGNLFSYTTFGESHGKAIGCIVDGFPPNVRIDEGFIAEELQRRRPGSTALGTKRNETDEVTICSGVFNGYSTGTPIMMMICNSDQKSNDYSNLENAFRPGHADYTFFRKYGIRDHRGGGRSSGRETAARVAAGALAKLYLRDIGIEVSAGVIQVGPIKASGYDWKPPFKGPLYAPECKEKEKMEALIEEVRAECDSIGAVIECHITGVPAGLGNPVFDKLDARLGSAILSLGGVKAFEIGSGMEAARLRGSENNDQMRADDEGNAIFLTNNAGGILGGISNGNEIIFRAGFKPTPSIARKQMTVDKEMNSITMEIKGRHDPCIAPRAVVVVEAMAAAVILDELLISKAYSR